MSSPSTGHLESGSAEPAKSGQRGQFLLFHCPDLRDILIFCRVADRFGAGGAALSIALDILAAVVFVLSSGVAFQSRFRSNRLAILGASIIALISSYFLFESLYHRFFQSAKVPSSAFNEELVWNSKGDYLFTSNILEQFAKVAGANVCRIQCTIGAFDLSALPIEGADWDPRAFLVTTTDQSFCGSGGCASAVMIYRQGRMYMIGKYSGPQISDRQAMIIAREALSHPPK